MITEKIIREIGSKIIEEKGLFLVDVIIKDKNEIWVEVDGPKGIKIADCVEISRFIEDHLDREKEDFSLNVSSPGMGEPFKVKQQYYKYIGRNVSILTKEGKRYEGALKNYDGENITLEWTKKVKIEGKKKKETITETETFKQTTIKEIKLIFSFK